MISVLSSQNLIILSVKECNRVTGFIISITAFKTAELLASFSFVFYTWISIIPDDDINLLIYSDNSKILLYKINLKHQNCPCFFLHWENKLFF